MKRKIYILAAEPVVQGIYGYQYGDSSLPLLFPGVYEVVIEQDLAEEGIEEMDATVPWGKHRKTVTEYAARKRFLMDPSTDMPKLSRVVAKVLGREMKVYSAHASLKEAISFYFQAAFKHFDASSLGSLGFIIRAVAPWFAVDVSDGQLREEALTELPPGRGPEDVARTIAWFHERGASARISRAGFQMSEVLTTRREVCAVLSEMNRQGVAGFASTYGDYSVLAPPIYMDAEEVMKLPAYLAERLEESLSEGDVTVYSTIRGASTDVNEMHFQDWLRGEVKDSVVRRNLEQRGLASSFEEEWRRERKIDWAFVTGCFHGVTEVVARFSRGGLWCRKPLSPVFPRSWSPFAEEAVPALLEEMPEEMIALMGRRAHLRIAAPEAT